MSQTFDTVQNKYLLSLSRVQSVRRYKYQQPITTLYQPGKPKSFPNEFYEITAEEFLNSFTTSCTPWEAYNKSLT
jgi:hypothetical protein